MSRTNKRDELAKELQVLAHGYGFETFKDALKDTCFAASSDTEDFENKKLSRKYQWLANVLAEAEINEPDFSEE